MSSDHALSYRGRCPVCDKDAKFESNHIWYRDFLVCDQCSNGSIPRERALARAMKLFCPDFRNKAIHECSPNDSGISRQLRLNCPNYIASHYYQDVPSGQMIGMYRSENLEALSFVDNLFDIFVSLDVFEHVFDPEKAIKEIWRTLKPGGFMFSTWPIRKYQTAPIERRAVVGQDGAVVHLKEPEIHGNPIDGSGSLVTVDYGYDIHQLIAEWASFDVCIMRFADRTRGIIGEYTDTIICQKT